MDRNALEFFRWVVLLFILMLAMIGTYFIRADIAEVKSICTQR